MITIQNGKLNIPDNDRFVGFAGDNSVTSKQFHLADPAGEDCTYTLCLRFDDDTVRSVPLTVSSDGGDTVLTWDVSAGQLHASGVVTAQIRVADSDGGTAHSTKDFFLVGSAVELDEDGTEAEYVTPSMLRNSINQALEEVTSTAPYLDQSGYWWVYRPNVGRYVRTAYHISGIAPDSAMSDSSENTVGNKIIKQYVDEKASDCNMFSTTYTDLRTADKVPQTREIAQLPLSSDIGAADLTDALRPYLCKTNVLPGQSTGIRGQLGVGPGGEVFFCTQTNTWVHLADYEDLYEKMDLVFEVNAADIDEVEDGSIFFCDGTLFVKFDDAVVAIAKANDVYNKAEINTMIGDIESLLRAV